MGQDDPGETERASIVQTVMCFTVAAPSNITGGRAALPMMFSAPLLSRAIRLIVSRRMLPSTRMQSAPAAVKVLACLSKSLWTNAPSPPCQYQSVAALRAGGMLVS